MKQIFWIDKFEGIGKGGYFLRNDLKEFFEKLEEQNLKPVAIVYDGSYNLEILVGDK